VHSCKCRIRRIGSWFLDTLGSFGNNRRVLAPWHFPNYSHGFRPVVTGSGSIVPDGIGYAEVINAGKSRYNEDEAAVVCGSFGSGSNVVKYTYVGLFDGHGGPVRAFVRLFFRMFVRLFTITIYSNTVEVPIYT
jgi:hypothetical protein